MALTASSNKTEQAKNFAIDVARIAAAHCTDVVLLDVRGISSVTDFFVIGTGNSARQMRSIGDEAEELGTTRDFVAISHNGYDGENWILTDFFDVVLHLFSSASRTYYDLDGLWGDAPRVIWQTSPEG